VWQDDDTGKFFAKFVDIHVKLKNYKSQLI
jgi:hypothetical protein